MPLQPHLLYWWENRSVQKYKGAWQPLYTVGSEAAPHNGSPFSTSRSESCEPHQGVLSCIFFWGLYLSRLSNPQIILRFLWPRPTNLAKTGSKRKRRNLHGSFPSLWGVLSAHHMMRSYHKPSTLWVAQSCSRAAPRPQPDLGVTLGTAPISHTCIAQEGHWKIGHMPVLRQRTEDSKSIIQYQRWGYICLSFIHLPQ